ncbi:reticulon-4-interacting protein 1, mitochondrial-like [Culicoides brevitarsis]|uniref:reticulon-4-interacting protein 1, mitochondrial-like n=1 Tax=Culicoides brevitarsis TaxID=469753 RepID=UPI00307BA838
MDEVVFRASQSLDTLKVQAGMAAENSMRVVRQYSDEARQQAVRAIRDPAFDTVRETLRNIWASLGRIAGSVSNFANQITDPNVIQEQLAFIFRDEISRNNAFFVLIGLGFGTTGGFLLGLWLARPHLAEPIMKAVACVSYKDSDNVTICQTNVPHLRSSSDILVKVRAASVMRLDDRISHGYGRYLRQLINRYDSFHPELPLVLGRSCAGIVEAVGRGSKCGLEIGDEVWIASPWYNAGLASDYVVTPETLVARKPFLIGFEGAASLPYSGCVALTALKTANLSEHTTSGKRILIEDGCSPVGCVLTQLTKKWGAFVTTTCHSRSAPVVKALGADDVITFQNDSFTPSFFEVNIAQSNFINELTSRESYDVIFITTRLRYSTDFFWKFVKPSGTVVNTVEPDIDSDQYGAFMRLFYSMYIKLKKFGCFLLRTEPTWDGPHLCHLALDRLAGYVNDGILQTVVDQVYSPHEAERALAHVMSDKRIGSTLITFR